MDCQGEAKMLQIFRQMLVCIVYQLRGSGEHTKIVNFTPSEITFMGADKVSCKSVHLKFPVSVTCPHKVTVS